MTRERQFRSNNLLIKALPAADQALLAPYFERVALEQGMELTKWGEPISHLYFPEGGVASATSISINGDRTEVGVIGFEGVTGVSLALGAERSPFETFVQIDGSDALRIAADRFHEVLGASAALRRVTLAFVHSVMVQMSLSAVAHARLDIAARLARWLLLCHDRIEGDELALTHEFMATMIGSRRSGVTLALHELEAAHSISAARGAITVLDRTKLKELAGDAYGPAEAEYARMIAPFGDQSTAG
jgi:CRP-like cAMP-binding protein